MQVSRTVVSLMNGSEREDRPASLLLYSRTVEELLAVHLRRTCGVLKTLEGRRVQEPPLDLLLLSRADLSIYRCENSS